YIILTSGKTYFLKSFYPESAKTRKTFQRETDFLRYAGKIGLAGTARLLAEDPENYLMLTEYIGGERYTSPVKEADIRSAAAWIRELNGTEILPDLEQAADGCRCNSDHFTGVRKRLKQFFDLNLPALNPLLQHFDHELKTLESVCLPECRRQIVSPSDFGFHNVLVQDNRLYFVDFEYAGLDDPAKLVCDFFCQPDFPITYSVMPRFAETAFPDEENLQERIAALYSVHRIKWSCILMNSLLPERISARHFAGESLSEFHTVISRAENYYWGENHEA
ncbi:MAG: phosphotransferase, partial [Lentisphaeria bacterium]|nr:phosphotransferase [Lentisphaeria bacterium]